MQEENSECLVLALMQTSNLFLDFPQVSACGTALDCCPSSYFVLIHRLCVLYKLENSALAIENCPAWTGINSLFGFLDFPSTRKDDIYSKNE